MTVTRSLLLVLSTISICFFFSCATDKLPDPSMGNIDPICSSDTITYDLQIKQVVDTYCALSGCHVSGGDGPGDYSTFAGLSPHLNANSFEKYVIDLKDDPNNGMPPNWDANPGPHDFTSEDYELVRCWIINGYPEN